MAVDSAESEADLRREGYELREGEIEPNVRRAGFVLGSRAGMIPSDDKPILAFKAEPGDTSSLQLIASDCLGRPRRAAHDLAKRRIFEVGQPGTVGTLRQEQVP